MTDEETIAALAQLAVEARQNKGQDRKVAAAGMGLGYKTVQSFEHGDTTRLPTRATRLGIETYYGWRPGAITDIWNRRREIEPDTLTLQDLQERNEGVLEARHLTDDQLINELAFRLIMNKSD